VIDTTNPIAPAAPENGVLSFFTTPRNSLLERLQDARFVKAFNSVGNSRVVHPSFKDGQPTMFICGNGEDARQVVAGVCEQFGWDIRDPGKAEAARAIEPLCIL
jgi:predicted dinucleotide-binding enzyme